jgi:hypothetical protein
MATILASGFVPLAGFSVSCSADVFQSAALMGFLPSELFHLWDRYLSRDPACLVVIRPDSVEHVATLNKSESQSARKIFFKILRDPRPPTLNLAAAVRKLNPLQRFLPPSVPFT